MKFKDKKVLEVDLKDYPKIKINNKKKFKEMYKLALNKIDLFKGRLENIKEDIDNLEK